MSTSAIEQPWRVTTSRGVRACFELVRATDGALRSTLADDVRRGLTTAPRSLPPKHLYDHAGSALFDAICDLPEYYPTRAERALLAEHAGAIVARAGASELVELGSGMARKTTLLLDAIASRHFDPSYVAIDISEDALRAAAPPLLALIPGLRLRAIVGDFERDLCRIGVPAIAGAQRLFAFLGSTIGNLDEEEAPRLVRAVAAAMRDGDHFLLGADLVKEPSVLRAAYDDAAGVTAQFDKNLLAVIDRELDADFDLDAWRHEARWNEERSRIEMHLVARRAQRVRVAALGMEVAFARGESILTEISRKFTRASVKRTLDEAGMQMEAWYTDGAFGLALARARYSSAAM